MSKHVWTLPALVISPYLCIVITDRPVYLVPTAGEQTKIKPSNKNNKRDSAFCLFRGTVLGNVLENKIECHFVQSTFGRGGQERSSISSLFTTSDSCLCFSDKLKLRILTLREKTATVCVQTYIEIHPFVIQEENNPSNHKSACVLEFLCSFRLN